MDADMIEREVRFRTKRKDGWPLIAISFLFAAVGVVMLKPWPAPLFIFLASFLFLVAGDRKSVV